ncbi:MAG: winged helix-turn-helix domain-containing protein [Candidatus Acidiferrales bacterium]
MKSPAISERARFNDFEVDLRTAEIRRHGIRIRLQEKSFQILSLLLERAGEIVTREELKQRLWPADPFIHFEENLNTNLNRLRQALGDSASEQRLIRTIPRQGYRFIAPIAWIDESDAAPHARLEPVETSVTSEAKTETALTSILNSTWNRWAAVTAASVVIIGLTVAAWLFSLHKAHALTEKDTIVLTDFTNTTGDPVFDGTLRQGLAVQLEQSPFLSIISGERVQQTLRLMDKPPDTRITPEIARELCMRTESTAVIEGSIAKLGEDFVVGLNAIRCETGESLAREQTSSEDKAHVLTALGKAAGEIRGKLGESYATLTTYNTPLERATTPSLDALQAFSLGSQTAMMRGDFATALPFFHRAIQLDPNFAFAYVGLGSTYYVLGETSLAAVSIKKAYERRDNVSEQEKFCIESNYCDLVTGDLVKARQVYELWKQIYPRDYAPPISLGILYSHLGQYDKNLLEFREALRLNPASGLTYGNLVAVYVSLNRLEEARATAEEALAKKLDSTITRLALYQIAFSQNDTVGMARQVAWAEGKPGVEDLLLASEADTAAYSGRLKKARELSRWAVASAARTEQKQTAANYESDAGLREALFGNPIEAERQATAALALSTDRDVQYGAALTLALTRDAARAQKLADDLGRRFPEDTMVRFNYLPTIHAQLALGPHDPFKSSWEEAARAMEVLQTTGPYELGTPGTIFNFASMYPVYVRGEACLAGHRGSEAATEFQKILDHRGVVLNEPIGALAHLGLARAYAMQGDAAKARAAYEDFFTLWKDADPDIPILKQAKAEYAKLQ